MIKNIWAWIVVGGAVALSLFLVEWLSGVVGLDTGTMGVIGTVLGFALVGAVFKYIQTSKQYGSIGGE